MNQILNLKTRPCNESRAWESLESGVDYHLIAQQCNKFINKYFLFLKTTCYTSTFSNLCIKFSENVT